MQIKTSANRPGQKRPLFFYSCNRIIAANRYLGRCLFLLLFICCVSCSKKETVAPAADPRDQYIGEYAITYQTVIINLTTRQSQSYANTSTLAVAKGSAADEITVTDIKSSNAMAIVAKLNGATFTIPQVTVAVKNSQTGAVTDATVTGTGSFGSKSIQMSVVTIQNGQEVTTVSNGIRP